MLVVNVLYRAKPGMRDQFLKAVLSPEVAGKCRQEDGCIQYDYFVQADNEDCVLLVEKWRDRDAQKVHSGQPHMALIRAAKEAYIAESALDFMDA